MSNAGNDFVVDGPELLSQLIGCYFLPSLAPDDDHFVAQVDFSSQRCHIDYAHVHGDPPDLRAAHAANQDIEVKPPPAKPGAYTGEPLKGANHEPLKRHSFEQVHLLEVLVSLFLVTDIVEYHILVQTNR